LKKYYKTRKRFFIVVICFITLISGYSILKGIINKNTNSDQLAEFGFNNITIEELVQGLDSNDINKPNLSASITGTHLLLANADKSVKIPLSNDKFYVSFAPYINNTHTCSNHNLITCTSELKNESFHVLILDETGKAIIDKYVQSMDNGFIGMWMPKNITGKLIVSYNGLKASTNITTFNDSNTCITTPLKLN